MSDQKWTKSYKLWSKTGENLTRNRPTDQEFGAQGGRPLQTLSGRREVCREMNPRNSVLKQADPYKHWASGREPKEFGTQAGRPLQTLDRRERTQGIRYSSR